CGTILMALKAVTSATTTRTRTIIPAATKPSPTTRRETYPIAGQGAIGGAARERVEGPRFERRTSALRPLRRAPRATSPVLFGTGEERSGAISLLHRREDDGGGVRPRSGLTEGAQ